MQVTASQRNAHFKSPMEHGKKALKRIQSLPIDTDAQHKYDQIERTHEDLDRESARFKAHNCVPGILNIFVRNGGVRQSVPTKPAACSTCIVCEPYPDFSKIDFYPCHTLSPVPENFYKSDNAASYTQKVCLPVYRIGSYQQHRDMIVKATGAITNPRLISARRF